MVFLPGCQCCKSCAWPNAPTLPDSIEVDISGHSASHGQVTWKRYSDEDAKSATWYQPSINGTYSLSPSGAGFGYRFDSFGKCSLAVTPLAFPTPSDLITDLSITPTPRIGTKVLLSSSQMAASDWQSTVEGSSGVAASAGAYSTLIRLRCTTQTGSPVSVYELSDTEQQFISVDSGYVGAFSSNVAGSFVSGCMLPVSFSARAGAALGSPVSSVESNTFGGYDGDFRFAYYSESFTVAAVRLIFGLQVVEFFGDIGQTSC